MKSTRISRVKIVTQNQWKIFVHSSVFFSNWKESESETWIKDKIQGEKERYMQLVYPLDHPFLLCKVYVLCCGCRYIYKD